MGEFKDNKNQVNASQPNSYKYSKIEVSNSEEKLNKNQNKVELSWWTISEEDKKHRMIH